MSGTDLQVSADNQDCHFYVDIMDSIHFHLYHLHDVGLRVSVNQATDDKKNKDINSNDPYFADEFATYHQLILNKRGNRARFDRISNNNSSKFSITTDIDMESDEAMTALDSIFTQLSTAPYDVDNESIIKLDKYVKEEAFDTESMELDLKLRAKTGNIGAAISQHCVTSLMQIFESYRGMIVYYVSFVYAMHSVSFT